MYRVTCTIKVLNRSESNTHHNMTIIGLVHAGEIVYVSANRSTWEIPA